MGFCGRIGRVVRSTFSLGTDISGLLMIRIMILCVFILDYVVVIRLITWGGESAVDFQTEASLGSVRQSACVGSAVHSSQKSTGWKRLRRVCSFCQIMSRGVGWGVGSGAQAFDARFVSCKTSSSCSSSPPFILL